MKTISGPVGLPQSCAEIVSPSGVFTQTCLNFLSCATLGIALAVRMSAAMDVPARRRTNDRCVMANGPPFVCRRSSRLDRSRVAPFERAPSRPAAQEQTAVANKRPRNNRSLHRLGDGAITFLLRCTSLMLALSGHIEASVRLPLLAQSGHEWAAFAV